MNGGQSTKLISWGHSAKIVVLTFAAVICLIALILGVLMLVNVGVGHAVILVDPVSKSVSDPVIGPTFLLRAPWARAVDIYYATDSFSATIPCFSSDQLEMQIEVLVRWSLDSAKIRALFSNYPNLNYKEKAVQSILEETIRLITKNYTALETIEFREVVKNQIQLAVRQEIENEPSLAGSLMNFELDLKNIGYPSKYTSAIEDKLVAEQKKIQADFESERILILANASAQEFIIRAAGEAEAKVIEANATREAIELVLSSVGQSGNVTRIAELYLWVQALQKIASEVNILIVGADGIPVMIPTNSTAG